MTAVEWLDEQLQDTMYFVYGYTDGVRKVTIPLEDYMRLKQEAIELEKQQIIDAYYGYELYLDREFRFQQGGQAKILTFDQWYETYGGKGSDDHIVDTNEMVDHVPDAKKMVSYTKQDVIDAINRMYDIFMDDTLEAKKLRLKGVSWHIQNILESIKEKLARTSSQTEISDEEIEKEAKQNAFQYYEFIRGAKWYREQLKQRQ